jgi:hypothetical protein
MRTTTTTIMRKYGIAILSIVILATACKDKSLMLTSPPLSDYYPLTVKKSIIYRLDSTVTTSFGVSLTTHSYQVKDSIDAQVLDGLGRPSYRIFRTYTDTFASAPYATMATFLATPVGTDWIEYLDNNLRFMKLRFPIQEGFSWPGNSFIDVTSTTNTAFNFFADWDYTYQNVGKPDTVLGKIYPNTVTVMQRDETIPDAAFNPNNYQQRNYSVEVYAKGIGLIYKNLLHYIYQPPTPNRPAGYYEDESFGIKLQIISYN